MSASSQTRNVRLKDVSTYINRGVAPVYVDESTGFVAFNQKCTRPDRTVDPTLGRPMLDPGPSAQSSFLREGDLVVNSTGTGTLGRVGLIAQHHVSEAALVADGHVAIVRIDRAVAEPRFVWYQLSTDAFYELANATLAVGSTNQTELGRSSLGGANLLLPQINEQRRIVEVLDTETARIDALSSELIDAARLLEERASAAQIQLVSGRTATRSLRASGVEWLGDVPDHWSIVPLKSVARMESGHTPSRSRPELWEDCSIPWISLNDVGSMGREEFISSTTNLISQAGIAESSARLLPAGTVVLSRDATIGRAAIMAVPMATSQHFGAWVCGEQLRPRYLWLLFATVMQSHFDTLTEGSTIRTIGMPELRSFKIPLPALAEQDAIVEAALRLRGTALRLRGEMERQLAYLREHRQALITAAATGGLDAVRKVA